MRCIIAACALGVAAISTCPVAHADAQAIVAAWGNVEGMRLDGEVIPFEISLCTVNDAGMVINRTARERQLPRFARAGNVRTIATRLGAFSIVETVTDIGRGEAALDIRFTADSANSARAYLCIDAPRAVYSAASVLRLDRGIAFESPSVGRNRRAEISAPAPMQIGVSTENRNGADVHRVLLPVTTGPSEAGRTVRVSFSVKVSGDVDHRALTMDIDASKPGRVFDGLGGNFRIQNPRVDPAVIAYNLANLRVAWARVEMPWRSWQPDTLVDPAAQDTSRLDTKVRAAMEMARTAAANGAPVVVSAWFPPQWAVVGDLPRGGQRANGVWGNALDPARMTRIYASLTSYLLYLKRHYGVEAAMFSFNESDLGIDVRQTPQEHADLIKGLGAYMKAHGLATTMLLGDVSDATPTAFISAAMQDAATHPFIGAVSYHSWRGWSDSLLTFWSNAATQLNVPLLVAEASTDAGAYRYPAIFQEPDFALAEIQLNVRMLALSQPRSILQWQLTSDYSLLAGGGVYGDTSALRPTQRFWNLKQLASTPERVAHLPMRCAAPVSCAALGDAARRSVAVHIVNNGAAREATIAGIPFGVATLRSWTTDANRAMQEGPRIAVTNGRATVALNAASYLTLISSP